MYYIAHELFIILPSLCIIYLTGYRCRPVGSAMHTFRQDLNNPQRTYTSSDRLWRMSVCTLGLLCLDVVLLWPGSVLLTLITGYRWRPVYYAFQEWSEATVNRTFSETSNGWLRLRGNIDFKLYGIVWGTVLLLILDAVLLWPAVIVAFITQHRYVTSCLLLMAITCLLTSSMPIQ